MISGLLPLLKPGGPSSAALVSVIKRLTRTRRVGHAGTLDPAAEGVLVMAVNRATLLLPYLPTEKTYRAIIRLGITTDSLDATGNVISQHPVPQVTQSELIQLCERFQGNLLQTPPLISARHYQGKRLYEWARAGVEMELTPTPITISQLRVLSVNLPDFECEVQCSRGTYIRSLARDLGAALGCGAHLQYLQRTRCSGFTSDEAMTLEQFEARLKTDRLESFLVSPERALQHLPLWKVQGEDRRAVQNGRSISLSVAGPAPGSGVGRIVDEQGRLLAIARPLEGMLKMERVFWSANEEAA